MKVAVCVDDAQGMTFFGKRQSSDRVLIEEFITSNKGRRVYITPFSARIFQNYPEVIQSATALDDAGEGDVCFIENLPLAPYASRIEELVVYRWNRSYPSDFKLDLDLTEWELVGGSEFSGSSHDNITKEIYKR